MGSAVSRIVLAFVLGVDWSGEMIEKATNDFFRPSISKLGSVLMCAKI